MDAMSSISNSFSGSPVGWRGDAICSTVFDTWSHLVCEPCGMCTLVSFPSSFVNRELRMFSNDLSLNSFQ